jgi:DNA-binding transcriptional ArsR family regulator
MNKKNKALREAKAKVLKALAHPTRLYIVEELANGEKCVCKFTEEINADFSTVSKHLSVLKEAGLVQDEKRGKMVFYTLRIPCVLNFMGCIEALLKENLKEQIALLG